MTLVLQIAAGVLIGQFFWAAFVYVVQRRVLKKRMKLEAMQIMAAIHQHNREAEQKEKKPGGGQYL